MIVPILGSLRRFQGNFLVWWLCGALVGFHVIFTLQQKSEPTWESRFLQTTGEFYQIWKGVPAESRQTQSTVVQNLAVRALFDSDFRRSFDRISDRVDPVKFREWRFRFLKETQARDESLPGRVGLEAHQAISLSKLLSYAFFHLHFFHLFSNLIFLFIFASAIERQHGSLVMLGVFVLTSFVGGLGYWFTAEPGHPPMIGASAAVSGLMSFYLFTERRKLSRFFYFIYPDQRGFGEILLSKYFIIPLYFFSDFSSYLASADSISSVAYVAHLSGFAAGSFLALFAKCLPRGEQILA